VFGEFNYPDFGTKSSAYRLGTGGAPGDPRDVVRNQLYVEPFLVGVNYEFSFGGPVVARY
jgi:hypothetical protein